MHAKFPRIERCRLGRPLHRHHYSTLAFDFKPDSEQILTQITVAPKLGNCLLDPIPRKLRFRVRQPAVQDLLHLVRVLLHLHRLCVLLHLRDHGVDARGD